MASTMRAFSSLPPSMARTPGNLHRQLRRDLPRAIVVAAHDHVAIDIVIAVQHGRRQASETPPPPHMFLPTISCACSAAEPCHTPSTRVGRPPDGGRQRNRGVDQHRSLAERRL